MRSETIRYQRIIYPLLSLLIGLIISALLVEGLARVFFDERISPRFVIDPGYGVRANQANVRTRHDVPPEYSVAISTNGAGLRGIRDYALGKPAGIYRIVMLGDSFLFGEGVEDDQVVSAVLERSLNDGSDSNRNYEVLNFGVSGIGQAEELVTYHARGKIYDPDAVILFYFENDIGNNVLSGLYEIAEDGGVTRTDASYLPAVRIREILYGIRPVRWLFEHSSAWNVVRNRLAFLVEQSRLRNEDLHDFSGTNQRSVELTRALLNQFVIDIKADGALPVIIIIPDKNTMESNFPLSAEDIAAMGAKLLDGREYLDVQDYWAVDAHWKASGHRKTAEAIARILE